MYVRSMKRTLTLLFCGLALVSMKIQAQESVAEKLINEKRPLVIAHRGYSMVAPENSLAAFELGIAAGADLIELDYHHSKDGIPVVMHDYTLDRTSNATNQWRSSKVRIDRRDAEEFAKLDAGSW